MYTGTFAAIDLAPDRSGQDTLISMEETDAPLADIVAPVFSTTDEYWRNVPDVEVLAALRIWCRQLGLLEASAILRRLTRKAPRIMPRERAPLWLLQPGIGADEDLAEKLNCNPNIVDVLRTLVQTRDDSPHAETYTRLAAVVERDLWP